MISTREKAVEMIKYMPDESMDFIISMLEALTNHIAKAPNTKAYNLDNFFAAAGNIKIDSDAVLKLREESTI